MSRGGAVPKTAPVGWIFLDRHRHDGYTIRWQRGDAMAYLLAGNQMFSHQKVDVLHTIPLPVTGWTDLEEIRQLGQRWLRQAASASARP